MINTLFLEEVNPQFNFYLVDTIDVIVRNNDDEILISIKDTGIDFNPVIENENLEFDNISVLNKIADKIDYSRVLGLTVL